MNTTMADGAEQRLDAQIAEALFGQPGMSKMDVANRVRELRGDGPALLVGGRTTCDSLNARALLATATRRAFEFAFSDQPSPGGQGDARAIIEEFIQCATLGRPHGKLIAQAKDYLAARQPVTMDDALSAGDGTLHGAIDHWQERALRAEAELAARQPEGATVKNSLTVAARQPVGQEPDAYMVDGRIEQGLFFDKTAAEAMAATNAGDVVSLFRPTAQAVDLGAVREALQAAEGLATVCASVDGYSREEVAASGREMKRQFSDALAKIDGKAVGND